MRRRLWKQINCYHINKDKDVEQLLDPPQVRREQLLPIHAVDKSRKKHISGQIWSSKELTDPWMFSATGLFAPPDPFA